MNASTVRVRSSPVIMSGLRTLLLLAGCLGIAAIACFEEAAPPKTPVDLAKDTSPKPAPTTATGGPAIATCNDTGGTSKGHDFCQLHPECLCASKIITCPHGSWVTQYYLTEGSCAAATSRGGGGGGGGSGDAGGGIPDVVHTECSTTQADQVANAFRSAGKILATAIGRMSDPSMAKRVKQLLMDNFSIGASCDTGSYPAAQVLKDMNALLPKIGVIETPKCPDKVRLSPNVTGDEVRHANAAPNGPNSNDFSYYPDFFQATFASSRPRTILHEMAHAWLDRTDVSYHGDSSYPGCPVAQTNADSIASFIFDLGQ